MEEEHDKWSEAVKKETDLHKWSVLLQQASVGGCQQVLGTKTLALEIRPKEGAGNTPATLSHSTHTHKYLCTLQSPDFSNKAITAVKVFT